MIVLDASAVVELLLNTPKGRQVGERIASPEESLAAPHLIDLEVAQVVRRYVHSDVISAARGQQAIDTLQRLDLERYPHDVLLPRVWALRDNMTAYDGAYVALAEALRAPLLTTDSRLAAAPGHRASIELL